MAEALYTGNMKPCMVEVVMYRRDEALYGKIPNLEAI